MGRALILWVEDNPEDVLLVRDALQESRVAAELIVASNAVQLFRYMERRAPFVLEKAPDLILVDLNLPGIRGTVVLYELRKHSAWRSVPIVVLTSSTNDTELNACRDFGAIECLAKPPSFDGYLAIVERLKRYLPGSGGHSTAVDRPSSDPGNGPASGSSLSTLMRIGPTARG